MSRAKTNRRSPLRKKTPPVWLYLLLGGVVLAMLLFVAMRSQGRLRVSLDEAKRHYDAGTAIFVDVRAAEAYRSAHIPGALSIPLGEIEARSGELSPEARIITYCT